jgi:GNAT superfamily N-acetyltransferase
VTHVLEIGSGELTRFLDVVERARGEPLASVEEMIDWREQADDMAWFLARVDGVDAGAGLALLGWHSAPGVGTCEAYVLPEHRDQGIGTDLFRELALWLSQRGCVEVESAVLEHDQESRTWAERRGFREIGRSSRLVLDLEEIAEPPVSPPAGIEIVEWRSRPDLALGMYEVYKEASPDIPGEEHTVVPPFERWLAGDMQGRSDRPEAVFVAVSDADVVGYAKLSISDARDGVATHDITAVKRAWRRRGLAGALKRAEIAWAKQNGYTRLETHNEVRNEAIRRLNVHHGYREEPGIVVYRALLASAD